MNLRFYPLAAALFFIACTPVKKGPVQLTPLTPSSRHAPTVKMLAGQLLAGEWAQSLFVGIISPAGEERYTFGAMGKTDRRLPDARSVYAIGSITKVFTGLLLQQMVAAGEVTLGTTVGELWPQGKFDPSVRAVTLSQLTTHTSGLPRMPKSFNPAKAADPYADFTGEKLRIALEKITVSKGPHPHAYSNLGVGLLGYLLAKKAGKPYDLLLSGRILQPLGLSSTASLTDPILPGVKTRLVEGYTDGTTVPDHWRFDALAGAGSLYSTGDDLLRFARLHLLEGHPHRRLLDAARRPLATRRGGHVGSGWMLDDSGWVWHNGGTGGFRSHLAFHKKKKIIIIVLASASSLAADFMAGNIRRVMEGKKPGKTPPTLPLTGEAARQYEGTFRCDLTGAPMVIKAEGGRLFARYGTQPFVRIYAAKPDVLYYRVVAAAMKVWFDDRNKAREVVLVQGKTKLTCTRPEPKSPADGPSKNPAP
ncbi:beta-lactamase family protein [Myxococcota bacterium]|nr:beta-lactamase family protein [Myxococcota bacterium]